MHNRKETDHVFVDEAVPWIPCNHSLLYYERIVDIKSTGTVIR
jgi:hypothetical protein